MLGSRTLQETNAGVGATSMGLISKAGLFFGLAAVLSIQPGGAVAGCGEGEPRALAAVLSAQPPSARQLFDDGVALRRSELRIPLAGAVAVCDADDLAFTTLVLDPQSEDLAQRKVVVDQARGEGDSLVLEILGPASAGARLTVETDDAIAVGGRPVAAGALALDGLALRPLEAALWFKPYRPTDATMFRTYGGSRHEKPREQPHDADEVRDLLESRFERFVAAGLLTAAEAEASLALFDDPAAREVFTDAKGRFEPHLMAFVLANAGLATENALAVFLAGENPTGAPARVVYGKTDSKKFSAQVRFPEGRMTIMSADWLKTRPFAVQASLMGHEAFHQDRHTPLDEELIASFAQYLAYGQALLAIPELAEVNLKIAHRHNTYLLGLLNSGRAGFPKPGILTAPMAMDPPRSLPGGKFKGGSFADALRKYVYGDSPVESSKGNAHLDRVASLITGTAQQGLAFDRDTIALLERDFSLLTPNQVFRLLQILKLRLANDEEYFAHDD